MSWVRDLSRNLHVRHDLPADAVRNGDLHGLDHLSRQLHLSRHEYLPRLRDLSGNLYLPRHADMQ